MNSYPLNFLTCNIWFDYLGNLFRREVCFNAHYTSTLGHEVMRAILHLEDIEGLQLEKDKIKRDQRPGNMTHTCPSTQS